MRVNRNNSILGLIVFVLLALCVVSIYVPARFDEQRKEREKAVIECLDAIRNAQENYKSRYGRYCDNLQILVNERLLASTTQYIPYSGKQKFSLKTEVKKDKGGKDISLMECGATYTQYLKGLNRASISTLMEEAVSNGIYPGLKIGDIEKNNHNAGNWE